MSKFRSDYTNYDILIKCIQISNSLTYINVNQKDECMDWFLQS